MTAETFETRLGGAVTIDLCLACQVLWFDTHESLQLSPAAVLALFQQIRAMTVAPTPSAMPPACPRCGARLVETHDLQRQTRFQYLRCPNEHGRLITFVDFLREKDFIRPLSPEQIEELRRTVQVIHCSNCGAPVDLANGSACAHCGTPLSLLDIMQAGALRQAD